MKKTFTLEGRNYEITDKMPPHYYVWNIGDHMIDGYVPLCEIKEEYTINPDTLKAIHLNDREVELLRRAAGYGVNSLERAKEILDLHTTRARHITKKIRELAEATREIFERITEQEDTTCRDSH